ncbi:putative quinol monooxygenase [Granulosicoccus antarcticus]|uniref:ABM domain-containing protein n=1 Tax=Granulosicoccus antarcticus IMCC3135 TaxID=1192854 RepID=A0A2Z2P0D3_9GAMM|nr:antibiotic biosynthesis monooxygenase [Granulosicoccus antarcticus]ASJ75731.1 hypothetical protein IMCC3135_28395 [Granulosicoccus antarcticus IMCC3135]
MITRIVKFTVPTEQIDAFKASFATAATGSLKEPGFEQARLFAARADANTFFAYERLRDQEAHAAMPHTRQLFEFLASSGTQVEQYNLGEADPAPVPLSEPDVVGDDELAVFFIFSLRSGFREKVLAQFATHTKQARMEPGNVVFDLYTIEGNEDTLIVYERWKNEAALMEKHFAHPYAQQTGALLTEAVPGDLVEAMHFSTEIR